MLKIVAGIVLGLLIGAGCRWLDIPVPAPPKLLGALLVLSVTLGYVAVDRYLASRSATEIQSTTLQEDDGAARPTDKS